MDTPGSTVTLESRCFACDGLIPPGSGDYHDGELYCDYCFVFLCPCCHDDPNMEYVPNLD